MLHDRRARSPACAARRSPPALGHRQQHRVEREQEAEQRADRGEERRSPGRSGRAPDAAARVVVVGAAPRSAARAARARRAPRAPAPADRASSHEDRARRARASRPAPAGAASGSTATRACASAADRFAAEHAAIGAERCRAVPPQRQQPFGSPGRAVPGRRSRSSFAVARVEERKPLGARSRSAACARVRAARRRGRGSARSTVTVAPLGADAAWRVSSSSGAAARRRARRCTCVEHVRVEAVARRAPAAAGSRCPTTACMISLAEPAIAAVRDQHREQRARRRSRCPQAGEQLLDGCARRRRP